MALRGGFNNRVGFILAAAGSAVGLGNIWKFPFEVGNGGGGIFVLMYLAFCFILAFPVLVSEIAIGRKTQLNPAGAYEKLGFKKWRPLGVLGITCGFLILSYYNVVAGWAFGYFLELSTQPFVSLEEVQKISGVVEMAGDKAPTLSTYWTYHFVSFIADWKFVLAYSSIFMIATAYIVSKGISGGIEKAAKILMPTLLFMILSLVIYALSLPGATEGLTFYLKPDFSKIDINVIKSALGQAFFSLSLGMGALITYGSYVNKNENIIVSATWITFTDVGIAFIAGLMMFPFVFSMETPNTEGGAGLIFMALPEMFQNLGPILGHLVGGFFFLLLSFAALTSTVSLLEVPVAYVVDEFRFRRLNATVFISLIIFLMGLPSLLGNGAVSWLTDFITYAGSDKPITFLDFIDDIANDTLLPLGGFLICIFTAYIWKKHNLANELAQGMPHFRGSLTEKLVNIGISYISPTILFILVVLTILNTYFGIDLINILKS